MRNMVSLLLALSLVLSPVTSTLAAAFGFHGDHVHFDHSWHAPDFDRLGAHESHDSHDSGTPMTHSHADQVHFTFFMAVPATTFVHPIGLQELASPMVSFPVTQVSVPPFRPPQSL